MTDQPELERLKAEMDAAYAVAYAAAARAAAWEAQNQRFLEIVGARGDAE